MQQLVSIITPAYNAGPFLPASIRSVLAQSYENWELLIVDDGSTDDTADIAQHFQSSDKRIKYVFQPNGGQAAARNRGLKEARGNLVAFLDADDVWLPEKLAAQLAVIERTRVDLVNTDGYIFCEGEIEQTEGKFSIIPGEVGGIEMFRLLFSYNHIATLSVLIKRQALDAVGLFDEDRKYQNCEDYDLWLRLAKNGASFYGMREKLMRYRRHTGASTYMASKVFRPMLAVVLKHAGDPAIDPRVARQRVRSLYRELISSLVNEGRLDEARAEMTKFSEWDAEAVVTKVQQWLLRLFPQQFNYVSRECLFRIEWHLRRVLGSTSRLIV